MEKAKICKNCKYWQRREEQNKILKDMGIEELFGNCKRYPPSPYKTPESPVVSDKDFCGEFKEI